MNQGILIAIEGTDGSGKATQTKLLKERLEKEGYDVAAFTFPRYTEQSSYFVKQYLAGKYGQVDTVNPYTSTLFYALDRYEAAVEIRQALSEGKVVITDRYTGSNMAHQGTKFPNAEERRGYFIWNDNLEFSLLNIPRPTVSFVLRVSAEVAHDLMASRVKEDNTRKLDIHEMDRDHVQKSVEVYDDLCSLFPNDFKRIDCVRSDKLLSIEEVHSLLWEKVSALLPEPAVNETEEALPTTEASQEQPHQVSYLAALIQNQTHVLKTYPDSQIFYTPVQLLPATKQQYKETITSILQMHSELLTRLTEYIAQTSNDKNAHEEAYTLAAHCLPAATLCNVSNLSSRTQEIQTASSSTRTIQKRINDLLPTFYTSESHSMQLQYIQPRNELDLAASIAYKQSDLPLTAIEEALAEWSYEQKAALLETALAAQTSLDSTYTFDILCSTHTLLQLSCRERSWQALTPRNGYDVPQIIEDAGLADLYERCFDTSLELHSMLQAEGYTEESQYATLLGHKVRVLITFSVGDLLNLGTNTSPEAAALLASLTTTISERHPIIGTHLQNILDKRT